MSDATNPAVVQDAQQHDWRLDLHLLDRRARDKYEEGDGAESDRLTAHIEYLDDLLNGYRILYADMCDEYESLKAERDALLAEHEAWLAFVASGRTMDALTAFERAHDNAERVILG